MKNNFIRDVTYSQDASEEPFWDSVYRVAFPTLVSHVPNPKGDTLSQRMGVDRLIMLANGQTFKIDEKKRRKDYGDILLEYISNDRHKSPGWIEKELTIDYLAYAIMPARRCYLFPWPMLRKAWELCGTAWKSRYPTVPAINDGYTTLNVPVPTSVLLNAVSNAAVINLGPEAGVAAREPRQPAPPTPTPIFNSTKADRKAILDRAQLELWNTGRPKDSGQ